eukprot:EG_transcript_9007
MMLRGHASRFIGASNALQVGGTLLLAFLAFGAGSRVPAVLALLFGLFNATWLYFVWDRIPFASVVLKGACKVVFQRKGTILVAYLGAVTTILFLALWGLFALRYGPDIPLVFLLLSLYWTWQVISSLVHTIVCSMAAAWYFIGSTASSDVTLVSCRRALTTSFGSVCQGSLLVAVVQVIRWMFQSIQTVDPGVLEAFGNSLLRWTDTLFQYFNEYAFVQVAVYGKPFREASRDTYQLMRDCGVSAVVNDVLLSRTLTLTAVTCSLAIGFLAPVTFAKGEMYAFEAIVAFLFASCILMTLLQVVRSTVVALFVCYAEAPAALEAADPELAAELRAAVEHVRSLGLRPSDALLPGGGSAPPFVGYRTALLSPAPGAV